jgi:uncharacterized protein YndB with AHSA1/START domain
MKMFQKTAVILCFAALGSAAVVRGQESMPDFGPDGLAGLSAKQRTELARGGIVLPEGAVKTTRGSSLIEAAFIIDRPPGEVWRLLSRTELQTSYVPEVRSARIVWEAGEQNGLELTVRVMGRTVVYRTIQDFDRPRLYFHWVLDPEFRSDLKELAGFWRFYDHDDGRTLARYGSVVKPRFPVPGFIRVAIAKGHVRSDLESVRKYVESGGTWRNPKSHD